MGKKSKKINASSVGLHEIKNKRRPCARRVKRKGTIRLSAKKRRRALKIGTAVSALVVAFVGVFAVGALFQKNIPPLNVDDGFVTVCYPLPNDGSNPKDHSALENIGYLNARFKAQENWYSEMHGTTKARALGVVNTDQSVNTYKQYNDGILIMADITTSNMVDKARQFCYVGDDVLWREPQGGASSWAKDYDSLQTMKWKEGEPYAHLSLQDFQYGNVEKGIDSHGLPGTEMSVYIINEDTLLDATEVTDNGDGTYTQTYYLAPQNELAPIYYRYQMAFTGGLTGLPTFDYITVTYTFDDSWQLLSSDIKEKCTALMGVAADCTSSYHTDYEYGTQKAVSNAYETYFSKYADKPTFDAPSEDGPTAMNCLTMAFASVLTQETTFHIDADLNGVKLAGDVTLDISKMSTTGEITARARFGEIGLDAVIYLPKTLSDGNSTELDGICYLSYGGLKIKLDLNGLMKVLDDLLPNDDSAPAPAPAEGEDDNDMLKTLMNGEFTVEGNKATLVSSLDLAGITLPLRFEFLLGENGAVSLDCITVEGLEIAGLKIDVVAGFAEKPVPALTEQEKQSYVLFNPFINNIVSLLQTDVISAQVSYEGNGFAVNGTVDVQIRGAFLVQGDLTAVFGAGERALSKRVTFVYAGDTVYLNLDGIKVSANTQDAIALIMQFVNVNGTDGADATATAQSLAGMLEKVLSPDFASLFTLTADESETVLLIKGKELLCAFGVDFDLGDVALGVKGDALFASAMGANVTVGAGKAFIPDTNGYTEIVKYAQGLISLFQNNYLHADVNYEYTFENAEKLSVAGGLNVSMKPFFAEGRFTVTYGAIAKEIAVGYSADENTVYLTIDGLKVKASVEEIVSLVSQFVQMPQTSAAADMLYRLLSLNFGEVIALTENGEQLSAVIAGGKLLQGLGVNFDLGDVVLQVKGSTVTVSAMGANVVLTAGNQFVLDTNGYSDLTPIIKKVPALLNAKGISLEGTVSLSIGTTAVDVVINQGVLRFANGFEMYLDLSVITGGTELNLLLSANGSRVTFAYGDVGATLAYDEFASLGDALLALYNRVADVVNQAVDGGLLQTAQSLEALLDMLGGGKAAADIFQSLDMAQLVNSLVLSNTADGLVSLSAMGFTLTLQDGADCFAGVLLSYSGAFEGQNVQINGALKADVSSTIPAMPQDVTYLKLNDFKELLDYAGACVEIVAQQNLNLHLEGAVTSTDGKYADSKGKKYDLIADISYYSGASFPLRLDINGKKITVNSDLYLNLSFALIANNEADTSIYLDFTVLDSDMEGNSDGKLDFFIALSQFDKENDSRYNPLRIYAPAEGVMTLLSSALAAFDIDVPFVCDYLFGTWLPQSVEEFKAFSKDIQSMLSATAGISLTGDEGKFEAVRREYVKSIALDQNYFTVALSGRDLFGTENDLVVRIGKTGGKITSFTVNGIASGKETTSLTLGISYDQAAQTKPEVKGTYNLTGIDSLVTAIVKSSTHEADDGYALNENFYLEGDINISLSVVSLATANITLKDVAFSITPYDEGAPSVSVRFGYDPVKVELFGLFGVMSVIEGGGYVELTGYRDMVYIKRVQTADKDNKTLAQPITLYRVMPLSNFLSDIFGQIGFMLQFSDTIMNYLNFEIEMPDLFGTDFGDTAQNILTSYSYTNGNGAGDEWKIALNGNYISGEVLSALNIAIASDSTGNVRSVSLDTGMSMTGISMDITAGFTYYNPQGQMQAGKKDNTVNIHNQLSQDMNYILSVVNWDVKNFLEGEYTAVEFRVAGNTVAAQDLVIATGADGEAKGKLYTTLNYPDLSAYDNQNGYTLVWEKEYKQDDLLPEDRIIRATYKPKSYTIIFESEYPLDFTDGDVHYAFTKDESTGLYTYTVEEYLYNSDIVLPYASNEARKVVGFMDRAGNVYTSLRDEWNDVRDDAPVYLTVLWEEIDYTVTFDVDGVKTAQTVHYGDKIAYPENPVRAGYKFIGWDVMPETVTGNVTITAQFEALTFTVTLESEYEAEGFTLGDDGIYRRRFTYTYGTSVVLPTCDNEEKGLHLGAYRNANGQTVYTADGILEDCTFVAVWSEIGYKITFVSKQGEQVTVLNGYMGDKLSTREDLPAVPAVQGYRGAWNFGGDVVTGDMTVSPVYTPVTYTITQYSPFMAEGFTEADGGYIRTLSYTYDSAALRDLGSGLALREYDFDAFYTEQFGAGVKIEQIDSSVIADLFGYSEQIVIYANWLDNTVSVRMYSDVEYSGDYTQEGNAYYKSFTFNGDYAFTEEHRPQIAGYQQLGYWYEEEDGTWGLIDNVARFKYTGKTVNIWVLWIKDISVSITDVSTKSFLTGVRYNISGTVEGGALQRGDVTKSLVDKINIDTIVVYFVHGADGASVSIDTLKYGAECKVDYKEVNRGEFGETDMNSAQYGMFASWVAKFGGAMVRRTFTYGNQSISTYGGAVRSLETYTVTFLDKDGNPIDSVDAIPAGAEHVYTQDDFGGKFPFEGSMRLSGMTYILDIAPAVPEVEGYIGTWENLPVTGNMEVRPVYTPISQDAAFVSEMQTAGEYLFETGTDYGADGSFYLLGECVKTYAAGETNVLTVPAIPATEGREEALPVTADGATL